MKHQAIRYITVLYWRDVPNKSPEFDTKEEAQYWLDNEPLCPNCSEKNSIKPSVIIDINNS